MSALRNGMGMPFLRKVRWLWSFLACDAIQIESHHRLEVIGFANGSGQLPDDRSPEWRG